MIMQDNEKKPALRFKGFTDPWEQRKLAELTKTITTGKSVNSDEGEVSDGDIGVLKTSCVSYDRFNPSESKPVVKSEQQLVKCAVEKDSVIVSRMNTPERVGACGYVSTDFPNLFLPDRLWKLKFQDTVDTYFVYMMLVSSAYKEKITSMASGTSGSMYNIPKETFLNLQLVIPAKIDEQKQLGRILKKIDSLITLHQRKYEKLVNIKKSMLDKMFPKNGASVPEIRFKGFTDPWEQRKLGEIAKEVVRNDPASDAPIMMITAGNGFIEQSDRYAFNNAGESLKKYILLERGELAYNHGASKLRPYGSCFALTTVEKARIPFVYHCFSVEKSNPEFLSIELNGANVENQLRKIVSSGARMDGLLNIAYSEYTEVTVQLPKKEEQDWIAKFFKHLDTLITLHQRKYEKLVNIKKSMLDKMFPKNGASVPEIRFKGFTDPWEQRKLEEYLEVSGQKNFEGIYTKEDVLSVSGDFGIVNQIEFQGRSFAGASVANYGVVETGDIVYTKSPLKSNPYGIIKANKGKNGIVSTLYAVYKPKQSANPEFVQIYFEQDARMNNYMHPLVNKGAKNDMKVSAENALKGQIVFPDIKEQRTISEFFHNLDTLITLHQRKLEKLQNIKKSCLEKMFV